ncbi:MAG TPA: single-stranded-DNA-specific exonuclease RecJ [Candidatus Paceibacterota bacterium]|nr:single-stranded-DNA-specific exonuclease RecJ [Candidatus Paceibacterota bacterium]
MKKWELAPDVPEHLLLNYGEIVRKMLFVRGLTAEADAEKFLAPRYEDLLDPYLFRDMEKAVVRIFEAMEGNEKIVVYSDYDCDGIPAATIMSDMFKRIGYEHIEFYIPHRHDEGYGLHMDAVKDFIDKGVKLLITFDLGITAVTETAAATAGGIDVIITDHHLPHGELPRAYAIINPHVDAIVEHVDENGTAAQKFATAYPEQVLSGAGVSFKLAQAFVKKYGEYYKIHDGWEKWMLDMAALGTLSDMVPIRGENRILSYFGMKVLRRNNRPGLRALFKKMKMDTEHLTEDDLTFMVAPRINAASRMDTPMRAFELLAADTDAKAIPMAEHLSNINDERKLLVARIMKEAKATLAKRSNESPVVVIGSTGWGAGILGLVAGKLTDELRKPVFVWGVEEEDEHIKGSCRSDGSVNVVDLMTANTEFFVQFGGHTVAGGFVSTREKIHFLEEALCKTYVSVTEAVNSETFVAAPNMALATISLDKVKPAFIADLDRFAPFGLDNPKPIFLFQNVTLDSVKLFGKTKEHLEITMSDDRGSSKAIAFFKTPNDFTIADADGIQQPIAAGMKVTLVGTLEMSYFRGREARIRIVDIF